jgi:hypothetical protein
MMGPNRQRRMDAKSEKRSQRNFTKRRQKIPLENPRGPKEQRMASLVIRKKKLLSKFKALKPSTLNKVHSDGSGINFRYAFKIGGKPVEITLDLKTSFGNVFGNNKLAARVSANRRLINSAGWALVIKKDGALEAFEMQHLHNFIKSSWGSIPKKNAIKKDNYTVYPVDLDALYHSQGVRPITGKLEAGSIQNILREIRNVYIKEHPVVKKQAKKLTKKEPVQKPRSPRGKLNGITKKLPPNKTTTKEFIRQTRGIRKQVRGR